MFSEEIIREKLFDKYIAPTKKKKKDFIGIEIEMPIVNLNREPVDFEVVHAVTDRFLKEFHFQVAGRDDEENINSAEDEKIGDILSYDCSYNNLELSMGREKDLHSIYKRFCSYYRFLQGEFAKYNYTLTGMGVNPYRQYNHNVPIPNGRYRMLFHHLGSYMKYMGLPMYFHEYPGYGTFSSASQVQLDVTYENLIDTIWAFSRVEPIKALLFSNSVLLGEHEELLCCRDMFWENSTHGINPHNIGMFEKKPESIEELLNYISSTSMYCVEKDGKYINFEPIPVMDYFRRETIQGEYYENGEYHTITFSPELDDLHYLRTFKFEDLTFRGTIEYRSVCCQPISDCMTVAAFHLGLKGKVHELKRLLEEDYVIYHHGYTAAELRKMFNLRKLPSFVDEAAVYGLAEKVLDLAKAGLEDRGYGEEKYLAPLYERIRTRQSPARRMLDELEHGKDLEEIIREFGALDIA